MTFEALQQELVKSMKEKNRVRKNVIADMVTCAKNMAIEKGCKDNITEDIVTAAILKSKKICQEQIDTCPAQRPDILAGYKLCMEYINELAPKMMTQEEIYTSVANLIDDNRLELNIGIVMKAAMVELKDKADGKIVKQVVTDIINKNKGE